MVPDEKRGGQPSRRGAESNPRLQEAEPQLCLKDIGDHSTNQRAGSCDAMTHGSLRDLPWGGLLNQGLIHNRRARRY